MNFPSAVGQLMQDVDWVSPFKLIASRTAINLKEIRAKDCANALAAPKHCNVTLKVRWKTDASDQERKWEALVSVMLPDSR